MNHHTTADFWACYRELPEEVQRVADANYDLLRVNPRHPSLHLDGKQNVATPVSSIRRRLV